MLLEWERPSHSPFSHGMWEKSSKERPQVGIPPRLLMQVFACYYSWERKQAPFLVSFSSPFCRGSSLWLLGSAEKYSLSHTRLQGAADFTAQANRRSWCNKLHPPSTQTPQGLVSFTPLVLNPMVWLIHFLISGLGGKGGVWHPWIWLGKKWQECSCLPLCLAVILSPNTN